MDNLHDESPMPFGKHKGEPMADVPAGYLHWLWVNGKESEAERGVCPVADYILRNKSSLEIEYSDGIW